MHPDAGSERLVGDHQDIELVAVFVESLRDEPIVTRLGKGHRLDAVEHETSVLAVPFDFMIATSRDFDDDVELALFIIPRGQNFIEICHNNLLFYIFIIAQFIVVSETPASAKSKRHGGLDFSLGLRENVSETTINCSDYKKVDGSAGSVQKSVGSEVVSEFGSSKLSVVKLKSRDLPVAKSLTLSWPDSTSCSPMTMPLAAILAA